MEERRYNVLIDDMVVANNMDLSTATILVKALFNEYYNDDKMVISVKQMDKVIHDDVDVFDVL